jgi:PAS domain S-box-containing protein
MEKIWKFGEALVEELTFDPKDFFDRCKDLQCIAATDGYFKVLNANWEQVLGWSQEELKSKPFIEFVHPDDRLATQNMATEIAEKRSGVVNYRARMCLKDGKYKWFSWSAAIHGPFFYAVGRDISHEIILEQDIYKKQQLLKALVQFLPIGIFLTDSSGNCTFANEKWSELVGISIKDTRGMDWMDVVHPQDRPRVLDEWTAAQDQERYFYLSFHLANQNASTRQVLGKATALRSEQDQVVGYLGAFTPIRRIAST